MLAERDAEIALSPWLPLGHEPAAGATITVEDLHNACAMTYPSVYRITMTGTVIREVLEDVGDNLFNPDPYYQQGGDMVRVGGMGYAIDVSTQMGSRISDMTLLATGEPIEPNREYTVAGWASINPEGGRPADLGCRDQLRQEASAPYSEIKPNRSVIVDGAFNNWYGSEGRRHRRGLCEIIQGILEYDIGRI
jgi:sulfur-oxidizing protein SoxB